jgi:cytochrome c biogenesis protein CcmG/thiol:disulfide interchange protein DsbE
MTDTNNLPFEMDEEDIQPRRGLSIGSIVLLIGIALTAMVFGVALTRQNQGQPTAGPAPDWTITTFDGQEITLSELRGQVVVVNFWASWCGPCRVEAPDLQNVWERYREQGVVLVGIAWADTDSKSLEFLDEFGITYPNAPDKGTRIGDDYHIQGVPETFVIDRDGNIAEFIYAPTSAAQLSAIIERLL